MLGTCSYVGYSGLQDVGTDDDTSVRGREIVFEDIVSRGVINFKYQSQNN